MEAGSDPCWTCYWPWPLFVSLHPPEWEWLEMAPETIGVGMRFCRDPYGISGLDWILPTKKVESVIWRVTKKLVPCHVIWDMTDITLRCVTLRYVGAGSHVELIMRVSFWDYLDVFFLIMFRLRYTWGSSVWDPWDETGRKLVAEGSTLVVTISWLCF